jgi:hypothetical protein
MMDYRLDGMAEHGPALGERLLALAEDFYTELRLAEGGAPYQPALARLEQLADAVRPISELTATSIDEALAVCAAAARDQTLPETPAFRGFFGHGQQYVSFMKRASAPIQKA